MKTPEQWHDEIGYASSCPKLTKHRTDKIREIQLDMLEHAALLLAAHADSPTRGFNAILRLIVKLKRAAEMPNDPKLSHADGRVAPQAR
jgi:hypothetical protein